MALAGSTSLGSDQDEKMKVYLPARLAGRGANRLRPIGGREGDAGDLGPALRSNFVSDDRSPSLAVCSAGGARAICQVE